MAPVAKVVKPKPAAEGSKLPSSTARAKVQKRLSMIPVRANNANNRPAITKQKAELVIPTVDQAGVKKIKPPVRNELQENRPRLPIDRSKTAKDLKTTNDRNQPLEQRKPWITPSANTSSQRRNLAPASSASSARSQADNRRSVYVPPRKSIVPSQASTGQSGRPRLSIMASRKSTFGLKVPGRRVSILQQQRAVGPVQFEIDDNATRSILTNQGVADDPETRAGSLIGQNADRPRRKSMYCRSRKSIVPAAGVEEATRALARHLQISTQAPVLQPTLEEMKEKTPSRRKSMYRCGQAGPKFGLISTPSSARKLAERNKNMFASTSAKKNDYLPLPLIVDSPTTSTLLNPIPIMIVEEAGESSIVDAYHEGSSNRAHSDTQESQGSPLIRIIPPTPPKVPMETLIPFTAAIRDMRSTGAIPKNGYRANILGRSPAKVPRVDVKDASGKSPLSNVSRYSRRRTSEFEQIYSAFSPNRLQMELETVSKQKKAIENLLAGVAETASIFKTVPVPTTALQTIVEATERDSMSPPREQDSNDSPSTSVASSTAVEPPPGEQAETSEESSSSDKSHDGTEKPEEKDGEHGEVIPGRIKTRRNGVNSEDDNMLNVMEFGMKLRSRNKK